MSYESESQVSAFAHVHYLAVDAKEVDGANLFFLE
jgi:hypothetical protein